MFGQKSGSVPYAGVLCQNASAWSTKFRTRFSRPHAGVSCQNARPSHLPLAQLCHAWRRSSSCMLPARPTALGRRPRPLGMHLARPQSAPGSRRCPRCARLFCPRSSANTPLDALECTTRARRLQAAQARSGSLFPSTEERCRHAGGVLTRHQHFCPSRHRAMVGAAAQAACFRRAPRPSGVDPSACT